ncbi:EamA-like transporter family protein [Rhodobacteraceae bacterium THAF1]|uniref:DMT family transporter n=1 Tax=Palleronia sp. THAF1 TaxID=2587842 RepID=UPI000F3BCD17|nr:DMT family transporter [Palleronia sp. THAF1]QFU08109.1 EamA-like transporter family protein [Palleronia sp. THAF1]VDC27975.1 EamA-like transporter family protein [Rhodobacteraceae bacterium THAF1]
MIGWVGATLVASVAQTFRFLVQRHLKRTSLSTAGATFSRFLFSAPLVAALLAAYLWAGGLSLPTPNGAFWRFVLPGGLSQILATACVITLFGLRNFAVGITLMKTEVILTGAVGFVLLGEAVTLSAALAIAVGVIAVIVLSGGAGAWDGRAVALGLGSGALFAVSAVCYRGAALSLGDAPVLARSMATLAVATTWQSLILGAWIAWAEPGQLRAVVQAWRIAVLAGVFSMIGSLGWFTAFALQNAAYVKALGQVEVVFSILASTLFLGERISRREGVGIALLGVSIAALILSV